MTDNVAPRARRLGLLVPGIIIAPMIFAWFTLRRGYSRSSRYAAFSFVALNLSMAVIHMLADAGRL